MGIETVAVTLESPARSAIGVIVRAVIVPVEEVDEPLTKVSGRVGVDGEILVSVTVWSMLVCIMHASKIFRCLNAHFFAQTVHRIAVDVPGTSVYSRVVVAKRHLFTSFYICHNICGAEFFVVKAQNSRG